MDDKLMLTELYKEMWNHKIAKDLDALDKIWDDDFVCEYVSGDKYKKDRFLREIDNGSRIYDNVVHEDIVAKVDGDVAAVRGKSAMDGYLFGNHVTDFKLQEDYAFKKVDGNWICTHSNVITY